MYELIINSKLANAGPENFELQKYPPQKKIFHVYNPDWVDDQLSHDESVGKYVMMNRDKALWPIVYFSSFSPQ